MLLSIQEYHYPYFYVCILLQYLLFGEYTVLLQERNMKNHIYIGGISWKIKESINHPSHYNAGKIEVIEFLKDQGMHKDFCIGNVIKYVSRYKLKEKPLEDLKKARWYLDYIIKSMEE